MTLTESIANFISFFEDQARLVSSLQAAARILGASSDPQIRVALHKKILYSVREQPGPCGPSSTPDKIMPSLNRSMDKLPNFDAPPVVERVLGAQFSALPEFTTAHAGWYWREHLDSSMKRVIEAPRIEDQFERFGAQRVFQRPSLQVLAQPEPNRIQIIREDSERMVQVQNSRFIYNWQKGKGLYPRYGVLLAEFNSLLSGFIKFVDQAKLGTIQLNQWEVTYVNHLPRGREWTSVDDLREMLPGFTVPAERVPNQTFDSFGGQWQLALGGDRGRLHILVQHAKRATDDQEIIQLTLTARGPVDEAKGQDLRSGLELGHEAIVLSFEGMTSDRLQSIWGKKA